MNASSKRRGAEDAEAQRYFGSLRSLRLRVSARNITFQIVVLICAVIINISATSLANHSAFAFQQLPPMRVAVIGFTQKAASYDERAARRLEDALSESLKSDARISLVERSMFQPALAAIGHEGSINLSREEARRTGSATGCDFFITGKAEAVARSESKGDTYIEAIIGLMIVDGRSGDLAYFDFIEEKAENADAALGRAANLLKSRAILYTEKMQKWRDKRETVRETSSTKDSVVEIVEEVPEEGSPQQEGFKPPEFLSRVKPEYTSQAERADISASVEASVVFRSNGETGEIEITRWAGFGLDEAAINAIRQLKFKPAMRDGKPVSVRAVVQYNFRRVGR